MPNINSTINLGLPSTPPDDFKNPEVIALTRMLINTAQILLLAIEQYGGITQKDASLWSDLTPSDTLFRQNQGRLYVIAGEALAYTALVHLYNDAGVLKARNANATDNTRPARGYCNQVGGATLGTPTEVVLSLGLIPITGVTPGMNLYLATANGQATNAAPVAAGNIEQFIGFGVATDLVYVDIQQGPFIQH